MRFGGATGAPRSCARWGGRTFARDVIEALLLDRGYERGFSARVEREAAGAAALPDSSARRDLTSLATFTIDPASARDFDDAISAERDGDGVRLSVHIADVGPTYPAGSATEAGGARGTASTCPGTVEPMLPRRSRAMRAASCPACRGRP